MSPIKPIAPTTETVAAVSPEAIISSITLDLFTLRPNPVAVASPNCSSSAFFAYIMDSSRPRIAHGQSKVQLDQLRPFREPNVHKKMVDKPC
ncbi:hypothetical protein D3C80_1390430 [compost metagenome]